MNDRDWKIDCGVCGRYDDPRSMETVDNGHGVEVWICQSCDGYYDEQELLEKLEDNSFISDGVVITNRALSECGRFIVNSKYYEKDES